MALESTIPLKTNFLQLLMILSHMHVDSGAQIDALLLDFSRAFHKVPYQCLFVKLAYYGIKGILLDWVRDLTNRTQMVILVVIQLMFSQECHKAQFRDLYTFLLYIN